MKQDFFHKIDAEEKAYWLGFMFADGCVTKTRNTLQFGLHYDDREHVQKFIDTLGVDRTYNVRPKEPFVYTSFSSAQLVDDLIAQGCIPHKSMHLQFPTGVSETLMRHFIRGYFDGDGSVYTTGGRVCCKFIGTYDFLLGVKRYLESCGCTARKVEHTYAGNIWHLRYQRREDIMSIYTVMYIGAEVFLDRKRQKFKLQHLGV